MLGASMHETLCTSSEKLLQLAEDLRKVKFGGTRCPHNTGIEEREKEKKKKTKKQNAATCSLFPPAS